MPKAVKVKAGDEIKATDHNDLVDDIATLDSKTVAYADVTGKPTTFAPSTHTHTIANVTGLEARLKAIEDKLATVPE